VEDLDRARILKAARALIGTAYDELDCSHLVHKAYAEAGLTFPYTRTADYDAVLVGSYFAPTSADELKPGDLLLYSGHVGIYDPDGCTIVNTAECSKLGGKDMRVLSARSGKNLGTEYGRSSWFGKVRTHLKWGGFAQPASK
jgi:cell wall-associated NlpC family hydrolase